MDFIMNSSYDEANGCWKVSLSGEVDIFNSAVLKKNLLEMIGEKPGDMYLDCKDLEYIDSTALGALVGVLKNIKSNDGEMHLQHVKPNLLKLFRITNLDKVFMIEGDTNE